MRALLIILALLQPTPTLTATWVGSDRAVISWQQPPGVQVTCLSKGATLIRCWTNASPGPYRVELGGVETDGEVWAHAGDEFSLWQDGVKTSARLVGRVLLPMV